MRFSIIALAALAAPLVAAASVPGVVKRGCVNESIVSRETLESGVVVTKRQCHDKREMTEYEAGLDLAKRSTEYLCPSATTCDTTCYGGSGGPNQNDCTTVQNAITNGGNDIQVGPGQTWTYTWNSCEARLFNQAIQSITIDICPSAFAGTIQWLAGDCNGSHGAQGGKCLSEETTTYPSGSCSQSDCFWPLWFIDVIHS